MGNCFGVQVTISLAFGQYRKDYKIPKIILVPDFCPLKTEIALYLNTAAIVSLF